MIYTADDVNDESKPHDAGAKVTIDARSVMVLQAHEPSRSLRGASTTS